MIYIFDKYGVLLYKFDLYKKINFYLTHNKSFAYIMRIDMKV